MEKNLRVGKKVCVGFGKKGKEIHCGKIVQRKDISKNKAYSQDYRKRFSKIYKIKFDDGSHGTFDSGEIRPFKRIK